MARFVGIYLSICYALISLIIKTNAQLNGTETVNATVLVTEAINQTEAPLNKINVDSIKENKTVEMHRITQPIGETHSSTQPVGRTLIPSTTNTSNNVQNGGNFKPADFRPSPQVNTYYEYNRFPVPPAFPEAKTFSGVNLNEKPIRSETIPWFDRPITNFPTTTQQPWYNKINFPTTQNPFLNVRDQPYPYLLTNGYPETTTKIQYPYVITGSNPDTTRGQYPFIGTGINSETTTLNPGFGFSKFGGFPLGSGASQGSAQGGLGSKFGGFDKASFFGDKGNLFGGKGSLFGDKGNSFVGKGSFGGGSVGGGYGGVGGHIGAGGASGGSDGSFLQKTHYEQPQSTALGSSNSSPWKKIIKFLTAIIPIGLLISALTPTVINVAPMNTTNIRGRAEDNQNIAAENLISTLNYINKLTSAGCEERVVCELLMGAKASENGEQQIENLLEAFTEQERDAIDRIEELSKIFEAAKSGECHLLACDGNKENTKLAVSKDKEIEE